MLKKKYAEPELEILRNVEHDVLAGSFDVGGQDDENWGDWIPND